MNMKSVVRAAVFVTAMGTMMACGSTTVPSPNPTPTPTPVPTPTSVNITGSWDLTLTASPTCSANLPAETRVLKYTANITQTGTLNTLFIVTLTGDVVFGETSITGGIISTQELKFGAFTFSEKTTAGGIALVATGNATIAANGFITGTLSGIYQTPSGASCNSNAHQITLVKK